MTKAIKEEAITKEEVNDFDNARYQVKTIIPLIENPVMKTYVFTQEQLNEFLDGYGEYAEFIINVSPILEI